MENKKYEIQWNDDLNTGINWIDNQHKKLLERINILLNAIVKGKCITEIGTVISFLENYVVTHFGTEEKYMTKYNFPDYQAHKSKHSRFVGYVVGIKKRYVTHGATRQLSVQVEKELWGWYKLHIAEEDKKFGDFIKTREVDDKEFKISTYADEITKLAENFALTDSKNERGRTIFEIRELLGKIEKQL